PSVSLLADTIFANGLGANPNGLLSEDVDAVEDLLPLRQRMSQTMMAAHDSVDDKLGSELAMCSLAELQALRTQITLREKQLLTHETADLFAPTDPRTTDLSIPSTQTPIPLMLRLPFRQRSCPWWNTFRFEKRMPISQGSSAPVPQRI